VDSLHSFRLEAHNILETGYISVFRWKAETGRKNTLIYSTGPVTEATSFSRLQQAKILPLIFYLKIDIALVSKTLREFSVIRVTMSEISIKYRTEIFMKVKVHVVDICVMKFCNLLGGYKGLGRTNCLY